MARLDVAGAHLRESTRPPEDWARFALTFFFGFLAAGAVAATVLTPRSLDPTAAEIAIGLAWPGALVAFFILALKKPGWAIVAVIAASVLMRVWAGWLFGIHEPVAGDAYYYSQLANSLLAGHGLQVEDAKYGKVSALFPPLYPLLLAGARSIFGGGVAATIALHAAIDSMAAILIAKLGESLGERRGGVAAAIVYLILPVTIAGAAFPQKEGLLIMLVAAMMLGFARLLDSSRPVAGPALTIGSSTALLALAQPNLLMLSALIYAFAFLACADLRRRILRSATMALAVSILLMLPWWIRNFLLFGGFVPLTTSGPIALAVAVDGRHPDLAQSLRWAPELQRFDGFRSAAFEAIVQQPLAYVLNAIDRLARSLAFNEFAASRLVTVSPPVSQSIANALTLACQLTHSFLVAAAFFLCARKKYAIPPNLLLFFAASVANILLFQMWLDFGERHRYFLAPLWLLLIGTALGAASRNRSRANAHSPHCLLPSER